MHLRLFLLTFVTFLFQISLTRLFAYFPMRILKPQEMLVVGAGGGYEIELARLAGVGKIDAVEINPAIVRLRSAGSRSQGQSLNRRM